LHAAKLAETGEEKPDTRSTVELTATAVMLGVLPLVIETFAFVATVLATSTAAATAAVAAAAPAAAAAHDPASAAVVFLIWKAEETVILTPWGYAE
jgi:hypothetical protein